MHCQLELRTSDASQVEALLPFASNIELRRELNGAHTLKFECPIGQSGWDYVEPNKVVHVVDASRAVRDEITGSDPPQNDVYVAKELWGAQGDYTVFDVHRVLSSTTGGTCYVYPRAYVGAVLTDVNTTTGVLTFQWRDGGLPVIPYDPGIVKPLVSLMGDLTVGKHPKYRDRVSGTEHNDSGATTGGDVHGITDSTKNWTSSSYGANF